ncbi:MATE family efflux transporter [Thalassolituus sp.]|jgi:MATE family multidrug resistance protein|uniref:MATE family efflux transporter n=1 Tax=Thalassolituus sp. TaxID=2030822 RepID=UPI0032D8D729
MTFKAQEVKAIIRLTLPILATQLAQIGMGTIDTIMSGYVSTRDLAGVAIGTAIWMPIWMLLAGILVALSPMTAQMNAARQRDAMPRLLAAAIYLGLVAGALAGIIVAAIAYSLPSIIEDTATAIIARDYLYFIALGMPPSGIYLAYRFYAEAVNHAVFPMRIMLVALLLNIPLNYIFVYGALGMPEMGGPGCGVGSLLVILFLMVANAWDTRQRRITKEFPLWEHVRHPNMEYVKDLFRIGMPIGIAIFFEVSLFTVIALLITDLGPTVVAGHQVALNISSLTFMIPLSAGMALTVRVGHHLGSKDIIAARTTAWLGVKLNFGLALFNATIIVLGASYIAGLYSPDPLVVAVASSLMIYAAIFQISDAAQIAAAGALRGYRDTVAVMIITFVAYWLIGLTSGYWLAYGESTQLGAKGFWMGLVIGLSCAAIALCWRLYLISQRPEVISTEEKALNN